MSEWIEIEDIADFPQDGSDIICCDAYSGRILIVRYDVSEDTIIIVGMDDMESDCLPTHILSIEHMPGVYID